MGELAVRCGELDSALHQLAAHLTSLLRDPAKYAAYFAWKEAPLPRRFQQRMGSLVQTHAKCRLCKWAYARKYGFRWRQETQDVLLDQAPDGGPWRGPPTTDRASAVR